jgi:hypothetical protein
MYSLLTFLLFSFFVDCIYKISSWLYFSFCYSKLKSYSTFKTSNKTGKVYLRVYI